MYILGTHFYNMKNYEYVLYICRVKNIYTCASNHVYIVYQYKGHRHTASFRCVPVHWVQNKLLCKAVTLSLYLHLICLIIHGSQKSGWFLCLVNGSNEIPPSSHKTHIHNILTQKKCFACVCLVRYLCDGVVFFFVCVCAACPSQVCLIRWLVSLDGTNYVILECVEQLVGCIRSRSV